MSQDTFLRNLTSTQSYEQVNTQSKKTTYLQNIIFQTEPAQNQFKDGTDQGHSHCNCTNIRVMQLFHEMKQEFPTIPDHVVNQHVIDNCHNRENCKVRLQDEIDYHLLPVQTYPAAQLLRILNKKSMCKKRPQSMSAVPIVDTKNCKNSNRNLYKNNCKLFLFNDIVSSAKNNNNTNNNNNLSEGAQSSPPDIKDMRSGLCNIQIKTYLIDQNKLLDVLEQETPQSPVVPQRPTTLRLNQEPYFNEQRNQQTDNRKSNGRTYSPIVSPNQSQESTTTTPTSTASSQNFGPTYSTSTSIQSPSNYPDTRKAEISVNVSLSPSSYRNRIGPPQRHQSTINFCPELPFTRNFEAGGANQKSYTSVNLVLRQPSSSPQSPIDITVGPNLTYSSSSYHARLGYQNNYHITVTDEGGVFSAFRIHPVSYYNQPTARCTDKDVNKPTANDLKAQTANESNFQHSVAKTTHSSEQSDVCKIIMRQHNQMEKLSAVLRKNKNKLGLLQKEVKCVMLPLATTDGVSERLDSEIEKLRCDCQAILNEIENSRIYGLSEDSIEHTNSIRSRQQPFPKQKTLRFQPPSITTNCLRKHQRSFPIAQESPRQQSTTYRDDDPSDFGVED